MTRTAATQSQLARDWLASARGSGGIVTLTDLPAGYMRIASGLGSAPPVTATAWPLLVQDALVGVVEIATFRPIEGRERLLLEPGIRTCRVAAVSAARDGFRLRGSARGIGRGSEGMDVNANSSTRQTVLVVDDTPENLTLMSGLLKDATREGGHQRRTRASSRIRRRRPT